MRPQPTRAVAEGRLSEVGYPKVLLSLLPHSPPSATCDDVDNGYDHRSTRQMPPKKPLALKEQTLFKELLTLYENRHLKKALKTADAILKKSPDNGGMWHAVAA